MIAASMSSGRLTRGIFAVAVGALMSGCALNTGPGPYTGKVVKSQSNLTNDRIMFVNVTEATAQRLSTTTVPVKTFAQEFPEATPAGTVANPGDLLSITIWEAPPAALFAGQQTIGLIPPNAPANGVTLPEQVISNVGTITVPYVGEVVAAGKTPPQIARAIVSGLRGKANQPQAVVRVLRNNGEVATVVGDVATSTRVPLTAQGERILDALAAAGGVKQDVNKMSIQLTRGTRVATMPLSAMLRDPRQNVMLRPGDVVTALYRTDSFTVLGATGQNDEINFESTGLTLAQALGRAGGLVDNRADPKGVFVFRLEDPAVANGSLNGAAVPPPVNGRVPVIYRVDLRDPGAIFVAQQFAIRNGDVLYISNAGHVDLQRFVQIVGSLLGPAATTSNLLNTL